MTKINVLKLNGEKAADLTLDKNIWDVEINQNVLSDAIKFQLSSMRQGTHKVKTRAEVSGGGRKPWKQKGTGRARQGSTRSIQWPGGGIAFGPTPRDYDKKMNKKVRKLALKCALSSKFQNNELIVVENLNVESNKTKDLVATMKNLNVAKNALIVSFNENEQLSLASRNNKNYKVVAVDGINILDIVGNSNLVIDTESVKRLEEVLK